jgi:TonB family protein
MKFRRFLLEATLISLGLVALFLSPARAQRADQQTSSEPMPTIVRKPGGVLAGSAVTRVEPIYPPLAKAAGVSGVVVVEVTINEQGGVISASAVSGHPLLKEAAETAARGWKFSPTILSGVAVKVIGTLTFNFQSDTPVRVADDSDETDIEAAKKFVEANPYSAEAHSALGEAYADEKQYEEAIGAFKHALRLKPDYEKACLELGTAYNHLERYDEEISVYKDSLVYHPNSMDVLERLANALGGRKRYAEAVDIQKLIVQQKPEDAEAHYSLGWFYYNSNRIDETLAEYSLAVHLNPNLAAAYHSIGWVNYELKRYEEAIAAYSRAVSIKPQYRQSARVYRELGAVYAELKRYDEATQAVHHAIELNPQYADAYATLGWIYHDLNRFDEAVEVFKKVVEMSPGDVHAHKRWPMFTDTSTVSQRQKKFTEKRSDSTLISANPISD